jgi:hypothetical protein
MSNLFEMGANISCQNNYFRLQCNHLGTSRRLLASRYVRESHHSIKKEIVMKMNWKVFGMLILLAVTACNNGNVTVTGGPEVSPPPVSPSLLASGGSSTSGSGGNGGYVYIQSYGAVKVLRSGTVDASFDSTVSTPTPGVGTNPAVVSSGTTTLELVSDPTSTITGLYAKPGDPYLYLGDGDGDATNDLAVTDLTVNAGATLVLVDQGYWGGYGTVWLLNDMVINGTVITDAPSGLYIEANMIDVESGGRLTTSAMTDGSNAGEMYLGSGNGMTKTIINRGTIEAKGLGTGNGGYLYFDADDLIVNYGTIIASGGSSTTGSGGNGNEIDIYLNNANNAKFYTFGAILAKGGDGGSGSGGMGGYVYIDVPDLVVNTGTVDVSGGKSDTDAGGSGGEFDVYVGYGDFYSSGTVRMHGGNGATTGGDTEAWAEYWYGYSAYIETAYYDNTRGRNGDIIISGTWEASGGDGAAGNGGAGGYIYLQTDAMGAVTINATMSAKGGNSTEAGFPGGNAEYGIDIFSYLDPYGSGTYNDPATPGKMRIAGQYDLRGGNGDEMGGYGGYFSVSSNGYNASNSGSDVELIGFAAINLNGGDGASGGSASSQAFWLYTYSAGGLPAGPITNEAKIEAKGGKAAETGQSGGMGGYVEMLTSEPSDSATVINNTGDIDISGGAGDTGGAAYGSGAGDALHLQAVHVINSGTLTANGCNGTTAGGNGGNITLTSTDTATPRPTTNSGTLSAAGGSGAAAGTPGTIMLDGTVL